MTVRFLIALALASTLGSCTLLNLDGFELPNCNTEAATQGVDPDELCALALNEENGFPSADTCRPFLCNSDGQCVRSDAERCDAYDNDCDGLVDEDLGARFDPRAVEEAEETTRTAHTGQELASVSVAPGLSDTTVTFTDSEDDAWSFAIGNMAADFRYAHNDDNEYPISPSEELVHGKCWRQIYPGGGAATGGAPQWASTDCSFSAIATDRVQGVGLVAAINTRAGCVDGQLRVGHTSGEEPELFQVNGPFERSNSFLGVGLVPGGSCTSTAPDTCRSAIERTRTEDVCSPACGAGESCFGGTCVAAGDCTTDADCAPGRCLCGECVSAAQHDRAQYCGVSGVDLAATRPVDDQTRGIVAFTSGSRRATCGAFERDVAVIGAALVDSAGGTGLSFVTTTNEAVPEVLGQTRSSTAPAVYGLQGQFVVAFPTVDSDALSIHVIDGLPDMVVDQPGFNTATCEQIIGEEAMCVEPIAVCGKTKCGSDVGICESGAPRCFRGEGVCEGHVTGSAEVCGNGLDEDCDGLIDENPDAVPCLADCVPVVEVCNASDDDCDGAIDEDTGGATCGGNPCDPIADPGCTEVGACTAGTQVCIGGKLFCQGSIEPSREPGGNGVEYLATDAPAGFPYGFGIDDDCDGTVDEDLDDGSPVAAIPDCTGDGSTEYCNGRDDDLDCIIDETASPNAIDLIDTPVENRPKEVVRQCIEEPGLGDTPAMMEEGGLGFGLMDDISIAGTTFARGNEIAIGVTWRETSESEPGARRIGFRILRFETDCTCRTPRDTLCTDERCLDPKIGQIRYVGATDPVEVTTVPSSYGPPHVSYTPRGLIVAGTERSGRTVVRDGGFVVVYTEMRRGPDEVFRPAAMTRSFAEHDGLPRDPTCTEDCSANITVTGLSGEMRGEPEVVFPRSYFDQRLQETRFLYFDNRNQEFISYGFVCSDE